MARANNSHWKKSSSNSQPLKWRPDAKHPRNCAQRIGDLLHQAMGLHRVRRDGAGVLVLLRRFAAIVQASAGAGAGLYLGAAASRVRDLQKPYRRRGGPAVERGADRHLVRRAVSRNAALRIGKASENLRADDDLTGAAGRAGPRKVPGWTGNHLRDIGPDDFVSSGDRDLRP